ncbi:MAG: hypothetical protein HeimC2_38160 [Candidatus Heimdallarchaeota archaeon LC_2]|nr:MAG: hypothetical protein HeimC2_38160 [Candidatus Heimdallarchaeota archaeon LC_2]
MSELCLELIFADEEQTVFDVLEKYNITDDDHFWRDYGDEESNFSVIGNQQSSSDRALIEKITNSIDAILLKKCLEQQINPESKSAPKSIQEALISFFGFRSGKLSDISEREQKKLAENIQVVATGLRTRPSIAIIDTGEGQTPNRMPETFLSLIKSNKARIKFVQGAYNMGSTGALKFCGKHNLQLIVSKRAPSIIDVTDPSSDNWGFTLVRKFRPQRNMKNVVYRYLICNNQIPKFKADILKIRPEYGGEKTYAEDLVSGTYVKLYEYDLPSGLRANIYKDLVLRLDTLLPEPALPTMIYERRDYRGEEKYYPGYLRGIKYKLKEIQQLDLEQDFPSSGTFSFENNLIQYTIYAFKDAQRKRYFSNDAILYTLNGQSHGFSSNSFLTRKRVGLSHLKKEIIIIIDCSRLPRYVQTDLFMTSRDRLVDGELRLNLEKKIESEIKDHRGLKELNAARKEKKASQIVDDDKLFNDTIQDIINEPMLNDLLQHGKVLHSPLNYSTGKMVVEFKGEEFPNFFKLKRDHTYEKPKLASIGRSIKVDFETDVVNDYFTRDTIQGKIELQLNGHLLEAGKFYSWTLWNGEFTLRIVGDDYVEVGEVISYQIRIEDDRMIHPIIIEFIIKMREPPQIGTPGRAKPKSPKQPGEGAERSSQMLEPPKIHPIYQDKWKDHNFNKYSAGYAILDPNEFNIYVNMDCAFLKGRIFDFSNDKKELYTLFYKTTLSLYTLTYINQLRRNANEIEEELDYEDNTRNFLDSISPSIIPLLTRILKIHDNLT